MKFRPSARVARVVLGLSLAAVALPTLSRLVASDSTPWALVGAFAVATALLAGPVTWTLRDRLTEERREDLRLVAAGVAMFGVPIVVGLGLVFGNLLRLLDAFVFGTILGVAVAVLAERTVVPERLRGATP